MHRALSALAEAIESKTDVEARLLTLAHTVAPLGRAIVADGNRERSHGIALGLMYAKRPEIIFDLPEFVRTEIATMEGPQGADLRRFLRQEKKRSQRRS